MLFPIVLLVAIVYTSIAIFWARRAKARGRKHAALWALCLGFVLFAGDHVVGYLWFKWYLSSVSSVTAPVPFSSYSLAIENSEQSPQQRRSEDGQGGGGGIPPIFPSFNAAIYIWKPLEYEAVETVQSPYSLIASVGYSSIEVLDLNQKQEAHTLPHVVKFSLTKRPDARCAEFEKLPSSVLTQLHLGLTKNGLEKAEDYCIAKEETNEVTAQFKLENHWADTWHPRQWTLPTLIGVYPSRSRIIDLQTGKLVYEAKLADFYGGWVSQLVRFLPDMDYTLSRGYLSSENKLVAVRPYITQPKK